MPQQNYENYWKLTNAFTDYNGEGFRNTLKICVEFIAEFKKEQDSLINIAIEESKPKIFPFNPNYINDFKGYQLGMNVDEIDRLLAFRKTGKFINSIKEFKDVTNVSDSLLNSISPFFKFPDWVINKNNATSVSFKQPKKEVIEVKDLNLVTSSDLIKIKGIGEKTAERILSPSLKITSLEESKHTVFEVDLSDSKSIKFSDMEP